jgi:7-cyano-7-deazaguanine synthase
MKNLTEKVLHAIKDIGLNIPLPKYEFIPYDSVPAKFEICKEMVDVMKCDIIADGKITANSLGFTISSIDNAIKNAVKSKLIVQNKIKDNKAILMLSGGIDSTTALFWAMNKGYEIIALSVNYKWRPKKEIEATRKLAELKKIFLVEVSMPYIMGATDLRLEGYPIPSAKNAPEGFIPLKNLVFYSVAAYFAEIYGCRKIIGGHMKDDVSNFSDAGLDFFKALENIIELSKHDKALDTVKFMMPFSNITKAEVVKLAVELDVPIDDTWSCYGDYDESCGNCSSCISRQRALNEIKTK